MHEHSPTHQLSGATTSSHRQAEITYATSDNVQALEALYSTDTATVHDTYTHTALGLGAYTRDGVRTSIIRDPDGQPLALDTLNGPRHYPYLDAQGSVQALITTDAEIAGTYTYTPYGTVTPEGQAAVDNPLRWLGQLQDPHGYHHLGHRYYHPLYARFTQPDPSGQELNPYAYAAGDPINSADPSGLIAPAVAAAFVVLGWAAYGCVTGAIGRLASEALWRQMTGQPQMTRDEVTNEIYKSCFFGAIAGPAALARSALTTIGNWAYASIISRL